VSPIVGKWIFTEEGCADTYDFRNNGSFSSSSGSETRSGRYSVKLLPDHPSAAYRIVRTTLKDNGGKDCIGSSKSHAGTSDTRFLMFNVAKDQVLVCSSPNARLCFGPLLRRK
jgi:hypothetical protein